MNTIAIVMVVLGLLAVMGSVYGYTQNKNDDKKRNVYTGLGIFSSIILVIGAFMMLSKPKSGALPGSTDSLGQLSNANLTAAYRNHKSTGDKFQAEINRRHDELIKRQANLPNRTN